MSASLVGSEMCIRDSPVVLPVPCLARLLTRPSSPTSDLAWSDVCAAHCKSVRVLTRARALARGCAVARC
eukprot:408776-Alexandrium_andersonii.AAC.1